MSITHITQPVLLCGGSGSRLWPLSRRGLPKQFICLTGADSLYQMASKCIMELNVGACDIKIAEPLIVTNEEHRFLATEQLRDIGIRYSSVLLEPVGKNTAPALTLAAYAAMESGLDPVLLVMPTDQIVTDQKKFTIAMQSAIREASNGSIVVFGVTPNKPETGYGYIRVKLNQNEEGSIFSVQSFVEKPDVLRAQQYLEQGDHFWNSGIFVLKASVWLSALETFRLDIAKSTKLAWLARKVDRDLSTPFVRPGKTEFMAIPSESIDYAVIEQCPGTNFSIKMIRFDVGWNDLGSWGAVWEVLDKDHNGNACFGDGFSSSCYNTLTYSTSRLVTLVGLEDIVVAETPDAVLVVKKSHCQGVKNVVNELDLLNRSEQDTHRKVYRPWGWYDTIDDGRGFKVKRINVKPKSSLSLQKHHHRAEHWIVVRGTAEITKGEEVLILTENESTYIPLGEIHRLANPGNIPLEVIEVQSGSYLDEDDIVRLEDDYGRIK